MILVTLGTQKQQFNRLLEALENSNINDRIVVQAGYTKFDSKKMEIFDFIPYDKMDKLIKECDLVITHGGTGSIIMPLKQSKKVIACPRLMKYLEHVDNHQTEIVEIFSEEKYLLAFNENDSLDDIYKSSLTFKPKKYISNTQKFINHLKKEINS